MVKFIFVLFIALLAGCSSATKTLKYGYLPGGDYPYYESKKSVDLERKAFRLSILDLREGNQMSCSDVDVPRDSELEGSFGLSFFENYVRAMIESNNGVVDPESNNSLTIELKTLSGSLSGALYIRVRGMIEFDVNSASVNETYCKVMADGDKDATVGGFAIDTRKGAFRKLVSSAARDALEKLMHDLSKKTNL